MDHPLPWLRYVDAGDLDDSAIDFDGLGVESASGEDLGTVDGFIIDVNSGRPFYVVVDAGGWFSSKFFLLPVGHASLDAGEEKLTADVSRDRVARFPGFDRDEFDRLGHDELVVMDERIVMACCPDQAIDRSAPAQRFDRWTHYQSPSWWDASFYRPDRMETNHITGPILPSQDDVRAERDSRREREQVTAKDSAGDVSPHFDGRAQPGDVIGVETGEQTHIGDTREDENTRRRDAEKDAPRKRE